MNKQYAPEDFNEKNKLQQEFEKNKHKIFICLEDKYKAPQITLDEMKTWKNISQEQPIPLSLIMRGKQYTAHNYIKKILMEFILYNSAFYDYYTPNPNRPFINALLCRELYMPEITPQLYTFRYKNNLDFIFKLLMQMKLNSTISLYMPMTFKYIAMASASGTDMAQLKKEPPQDKIFFGKVNISLLYTDILTNPIPHIPKTASTAFYYRGVEPIYNNEMEIEEFTNFKQVNF